MDYLGRARNPKFVKNLNGTHTLTFEMPDKYFDSEKGDYVHNDFVDALFSERKVKFYYKKKWYELYVKNVSEVKHYKSFMRTYTCSDAFIDELARNGYGITFDEELYNNVDEIGVFSEEILKDSVWEYDAHLNWGDFTEYLEEKLFKIPLSLFGGKFTAHKLNFNLDKTYKILNIETGETRPAEMGDDLAREKGEFWDSYSGTNPLLNDITTVDSKDNAYIYVPYSQLDFCYVSSDQESENGLEEAFVATEYPAQYNNLGYAIAPTSIDPNHLIEFLFVPENEKIQIDEAGLIVNKEYTYVMTVEEWNQQNQSSLFYKFEDYKENGFKKKVLTSSWSAKDYIYGNKAAYYEGYLDEIKGSDALTIEGKKIAISDRTEINISDDVDQYVTVYNNKAAEYNGLYTSEDWAFDPAANKDYRVCSKIETRQIVPQLARNLLQNSVEISSVNGWEVMESYLTSSQNDAAQLKFYCYESTRTIDVEREGYSIDVNQVDKSCLVFVPTGQELTALPPIIAARILKGFVFPRSLGLMTSSPRITGQHGNYFFTYGVTTTGVKPGPNEEERIEALYKLIAQINAKIDELYNLYMSGQRYAVEMDEKNAIANFGILGQEKLIEKGKTYALGIKIGQISDEVKEAIGYTRSYSENLANSVVLKIGTGALIKDGDYSLTESIEIPINLFPVNGTDYIGYILFRPDKTYTNPYFTIYSKVPYELFEVKLFEAYTKGQDQFTEGLFKYSGRDLFTSYTSLQASGYSYSKPYSEEDLRKLIIFEDDLMPGDTYAQTKYFIQQLRTNDGKTFDTFGAKQYLNEDAELDSAALPLNSGKYTDDDFKVITNYIDLNECEYYDAAAGATDYDCKCGSKESDKVCLYQKYGYCPYRFQTEKHCRRIRTLKGEKSNRFNLTQELGKVFKAYPMYLTSHSSNGKILTQEEAAVQGTRTVTSGRENWMDKRLYYITEKGKENQLGFRYEKNLANISRTINSDKIVTKLYVLDVDSDISPTGLSSIKTAEDNPSKDSFIIDFSYYIAQGLLDKDKVNADLYGINDEDMGYLKTLGYLNTQYDRLSNQIINLTAASFTELRANLDVNLTGIEAAQKRLRQLEKIMSNYTVKSGSTYIENSTFKSYQAEYIEQNAIYVQLIEDTFYTNGESIYPDTSPADFFNSDKICQSVEEVREKWLDTHDYSYGILGQFNKEYNQIKEWTKEQASYLKRINQLSQQFYRKYEPFLKEGTWSDSNYISDDAYYYGAIDVAKEGAIPKVSYSITPMDIEPLYEEGDYDFDIADTTYVEDIGLFGINKRTGLPNRLKVLISSIEEYPESLKDNKINVQNFTSQFEDLFQQVTATVQSLTFNENIYKRSSNFTSLQTIAKDSLQGALVENELTLLQTPEKNIEIDSKGQSGSDINNHNNKYELNGQGLRFSNNGGQTWNTSVGPDGIDAGAIRTGTLDASKIKIVDGNNLYFNWDKMGLNAYRDPKDVTTAESFKDYARFNKYGLSLVEKGQIKLRAGYSFSGENGVADSEQDLLGTTPIGFYLYNSAGKVIFSTETSSSSDAAKETARLNLVGEMKVVDKTEISSYSGYKYGGTKYIIQNVEYFNIGSDDRIIARPDVTIENRVASFTMPTGSENSASEYAAAIAYYYSGQIDSIEIATEETTITYENPDIIVEAANLWGRLLSGNDTRYCQFTYYKVTFDNQSTQYVAILPSNDTYGLVLGLAEAIISVGSTQLLTLSSGEGTSSTQLASISSVSGIDSLISWSDIYYQYHRPLDLSNVYLLNGAYYTQKISDQQTFTDGAIALYLNNREDLNDTSGQNKMNSRLFVCCGFENNQTRNILTVLKNGALYLGGTIKNTNGSNISSDSNMPDKIQVQDAYMYIEGNRLHMAFDSIVDSRTGESIENYVARQLGQSSSQIESDLIGRSHWHWISDYSVGYNLGSTREGGFDLSDNNTKIRIWGTEGRSGDVSVRDFIDALNLWWGGAYTNQANI